MNIDRRGGSALVWSRGGWFGSQVGSTLWLLLLGGRLVARDVLAAAIAIAAFALVNAWGAWLWRERERRSAYAGLQLLFAALSIAVALVAIVVNARGLSASPSPVALGSTYLPLWTIAIGPALMLVLFVRERAGRERA